MKAGEHNGNAKLTDADVREILERYASGESVREIAVDYCVTFQQVWHIATRRQWRHVP